MIGKVVVMEPTAYQAWLTGSVGGGSLAARGEQLFSELACNTCHLSDGTRPRAVAGEQVRRAGEARQRRDGRGRRGVRPRVDSDAAGQARGRLSAADADVPGAGQRRGRDGPDRVREVAARPSAAVSSAEAAADPRRRRRRRRTGKTMETTITWLRRA